VQATFSEDEGSALQWCWNTVKRSSDWRTAIHEAGHVVAAWRLGCRLHQATIKPDAHYVGRVSHARALRRSTWGSNDDRAQLRIGREIKIAYAGALAVKRAFPGSRWRLGADNDYKEAADLVLHVYMDPRMQWHWCKLMELETEALLNKNWFAVKRLAKELLRRRTMNGAEIRRMLNAAVDRHYGYAPLPERLGRTKGSQRVSSDAAGGRASTGDA